MFIETSAYDAAKNCSNDLRRIYDMTDKTKKNHGGKTQELSTIDAIIAFGEICDKKGITVLDG